MELNSTTADCIGMNAFSSGKELGNPLSDGSAVLPLQMTVQDTNPFNFHASFPELDALGVKHNGHTVIWGAVGSGKTTLHSTLMSGIRRRE